jgi:glycosyltransferase involved in cell wall biosynthesis
MKKVLFVIGGMGSGGAERVMSLLVNQGAQAGIEVGLALITSDHYAYPIDERVAVYPLCRDMPGGRVQGVFARITRLRRCIKDFKPDVVVSFLTICNIYACIASLGRGIPVVVSERNDPIRDCPNRLKRIVRNLSYRFASGVIFQTADAKACFPAKIGKKSVVIANPVKDNLPEAELANREKTVVAAGRLTKQKNYPMMLKAFQLFHRTHPEYELHIYGGGELEESLKSLTRELDNADCVVF